MKKRRGSVGFVVGLIVCMPAMLSGSFFNGDNPLGMAIPEKEYEVEHNSKNNALNLLTGQNQ